MYQFSHRLNRIVIYNSTKFRLLASQCRLIWLSGSRIHWHQSVFGPPGDQPDRGSVRPHSPAEDSAGQPPRHVVRRRLHWIPCDPTRHVARQWPLTLRTEMRRVWSMAYKPNCLPAAEWITAAAGPREPNQELVTADWMWPPAKRGHEEEEYSGELLSCG